MSSRLDVFCLPIRFDSCFVFLFYTIRKMFAVFACGRFCRGQCMAALPVSDSGIALRCLLDRKSKNICPVYIESRVVTFFYLFSFFAIARIRKCVHEGFTATETLPRSLKIE